MAAVHLVVETRDDPELRRAVSGADLVTPDEMPLAAEFAVMRARVADGPCIARDQHLPGQAVWLVCERRASAEQRSYLTLHPW